MLNSNIRCIEIYSIECGVKEIKTLNSNIRCIEILLGDKKVVKRISVE